MSQDLQSIFESITPDNIKDVPVIADAMEIFIETLEDLASESIDIQNIYKNDSIREELIKIYLDDLYNVLQQLQLNTKVIERINEINAFYRENGQPDFEYISSDIIENITEYITDEHFMVFRSYKEKKGTEAAIAYIYNLISSFVNISSEDEEEFTLKYSGNPFEFQVEGSLPAEFYEHIVYPLAHPLGFTWAYSQFLSAVFVDYFPEEVFVYTTNVLEVRSLDSAGETTVYDYSDRTVVDLDTIISDGITYRKVTFDDGEYLEQQTTTEGQTTVFLKDSDDNVIIEFPNQSSIYFDYSLDINTTVTDQITNVEIESISTDTVDTPDDIIESSETRDEELSEYMEYAITGDQYLTVNGIYLGEEQVVGSSWVNPPVWHRIGGQYNNYDMIVGEPYIQTFHLIEKEEKGDIYFDYTNYEGFSYLSDDDAEFKVYRDDVELEDNNVSSI